MKSTKGNKTLLDKLESADILCNHNDSYRNDAKLGSDEKTGDTSDTNPLTGRTFTDQYYEIKKTVDSLPATASNKEYEKLLDKHQLILLTGETGSGKTTQMPKQTLFYLLKKFKDQKSKVVCTQPRTLTARGVAGRVADELDVKVGEEVGYKFRFNNATSPDTVLSYVTDGTLLAEIINDNEFSKYNAVLIDEAHERSTNIDFIMLFIKRLILSKKRPDMKFIIMSATIELETFLNYFDGIPIGRISISGRTFPVSRYYLEDIFREEFGNKTIDKATDKSTDKKGKNTVKGSAGTPNDTHATHVASIDYTKYIMNTIKGIVNGDFKHIEGADQVNSGDILVFLPSKSAISNMCAVINLWQTQGMFKQRVYCAQLYSGIPKDMEDLAISDTKYKENADSPEVKIVLSTDVAETGVTVKGIVHVIDSGRVYESTFDANGRIWSLDETYASKSSIKQRIGRAGRVQPGIGYHMYTKDIYKGTSDYKSSEMSISNIDDMVMRMLNLVGSLKELKSMLSELIEPPKKTQISSTIKYLTELGIISDVLTDLGKCVYNTKLDTPLGMTLLACESYNVQWDTMSRVAAVLSNESNANSWFVTPDRNDKQKMKQFKAFKDKYTSSYGDVFSLLKLFRDFEKRKISGVQSRFVRKSLLFDAKRTLSQVYATLKSVPKDCKIPASEEPKGTEISNMILAFKHGFSNQIATRIGDGPDYKTKDGLVVSVIPGYNNNMTRLSKKIIYINIVKILGKLQFNGIINT